MGVILTIIIWMILFFIGIWLGIEPIEIHPTFRWIMLGVFLADGLYLAVGGYFARSGKKDLLITAGPYQFVRHPLYSVIIYSTTGFLAIWRGSWSLIFAVVPLSFLWSWLCQFEEQHLLKRFGREYEKYRERTGEFFPSIKAFQTND